MTAAGTPQRSEADEYKPYDQFILFGDSITQMACDHEYGGTWHPALQGAYCRKLDVINRGLGGYTTAHAIKIFPTFFPTPQAATVRFMTIFFGANDACVPGHVQHVPIEQYKENLQKIVQHPVTRAQNPRIIIITPPPINEYQLQDFDLSKSIVHPSRTASRAKLYAEAARDVAASLQVPAVDLWTAFMRTVGWQEGQPLIGSRDAPNNDKFGSLFTDGLHLTAGGYRIIHEEVMEVIKANWPDQLPAALPMVFPSWVDL